MDNNNQFTSEMRNEQSAMPKKKKSKAKGVIIALVVVLVLCIMVIIGLVVLGIAGLGGVGLFFLNKAANQKVPEVQVVETTEATTWEVETQAPVATEPDDEVYNDYITAPEYVYENDSYYISYDTPAHAGVNLRESPTDESFKIMVLPEGTTVRRLFEPGENEETKYVLVSVEIDGVEYVGYVMQRYISCCDYSMFESYVSYNTPSHAGLVLRETADGNSDKIMVIPEGTQLRVCDDTTGAYWAVEALYEGECYYGYVLAKYIESYY